MLRHCTYPLIDPYLSVKDGQVIAVTNISSLPETTIGWMNSIGRGTSAGVAINKLQRDVIFFDMIDMRLISVSQDLLYIYIFIAVNQIASSTAA